MNFYKVTLQKGEKPVYVEAEGFSLKSADNYNCFVFYANDKLVAAFTAGKVVSVENMERP